MTLPAPQPQQLAKRPPMRDGGGCSFTTKCHARELKFPATGKSTTGTCTDSPKKRVSARSTACSATSLTSCQVAEPRRSSTPPALPCTTPQKSTARRPSDPKNSNKKSVSASAESVQTAYCATLESPMILKRLRRFYFVAAVKLPGQRCFAVLVSTFAESLPKARASIVKTCRFFYGPALKGIRG